MWKDVLAPVEHGGYATKGGRQRMEVPDRQVRLLVCEH
jgi:hypothetical protein